MVKETLCIYKINAGVFCTLWFCDHIGYVKMMEFNYEI